MIYWRDTESKQLVFNLIVTSYIADSEYKFNKDYCVQVQLWNQSMKIMKFRFERQVPNIIFKIYLELTEFKRPRKTETKK